MRRMRSKMRKMRSKMRKIMRSKMRKMRSKMRKMRMRGVHMRTYAYVRIGPRGKRAESTCVRTRTYVSGRVENVWSPHAYVRTRPRPPYGGYSPRTHAYARMTSLPVLSRHFRAHMGGVILLRQRKHIEISL